MEPINPYAPSDSPSAAEAVGVPPDARLACPICGSPLSPVAFLLPGTRCRVCGNRLRLRSNKKTRLLAFATFLACAVEFGVIVVIGLPPIVGLLLAIATYLVCTTIWFHMYARPHLVSWLGFSSKAAVERARAEFSASQGKAE